MSSFIRKHLPITVVDPVDPEQPGAQVVSAEPVAATPGLVVYTSNGYADNPMRIDPTGTTVQPVSIVSGGGGTQYLNGFAISSGSLETTAASGYDGTNVRALLTSNTGQLHVIVDSGGSSGTQYVEGTTVATATGTVALGKDSSNVVHALATDASGQLNVNVVSGGGSNPSVGLTGVIAPTSATEVGAVGADGKLYGFSSSTNDGRIDVNVTFPATQAVTQSTSPWVVSGTVTANQGTSPWVVSLASTTITGTVAVTQSTSPWVVSGTVTANAGTGTFTTQDAADGTIGAAVGTVASMAGFKDNSGNVAFGTLDAAGNLKVVASGTTSTQYANGTAVATPTGTVALGYDGANVRALLTDTGGQLKVLVENFPATVAVTQSTSPWVVSLTSTTITGTVSVTQGTSPWVVSGTDSDNAANSTAKVPTIPARANAAAPSWTEGHEVPLSTDLSGALRVLVPGTVSVTQGTSPWVVSLASTTITGTVSVTQGTSPWVVTGTDADNAANSTSKLPTLPARANTSAPSWTDGHEVPLSVDLSGNLRVTGGGGGTQYADNAASGSTPTGTMAMGWDSTNSKVRALKVNSNQSLIIAFAPGSSTFVEEGGSTGAIAIAWDSSTAGNTVKQILNGVMFNSVMIGLIQTSTITGGVVTFEGSMDGTTYFPVQTYNASTGLLQGTTYTLQASTNVVFQANTNGFAYFRLRLSTVITGSGTVTVHAGHTSFATTPVVTVGNTVAVSGTVAVTQSTSPWVVSGTVTSNQGTAAASTAPWYGRPGAPTTANWSQAAITFSGSGDNTIVAASGSTTIRIMRIFFVNSDATNSTNITIKDSTPTNFSGAFRLASGGNFSGDSEGEPLYVSGAGKGFQINSSAAVQISGTVWYTQS